MMPAEQPHPSCEFVSHLDNVLTLLHPKKVYLLPLPPEASDAWRC